MPPFLSTSNLSGLFRFWDVGIAVGTIVVLMCVFTFWARQQKVKRSLIALAWFPVFVLVLLNYRHMISEQESAHQLWVEDVKGIAKVLAATIESLGHAQLTDLKDERQRAIYQQLRNLQTQWSGSVPTVASIYTLRRRPGVANQCVWAVTCDADLNKDGEISGPSELGEAYGSPHQRWRNIFERGFNGETAVDEGLHGNNKNGDYVTVVAPLNDFRISDQSHPFTEAILAVDVYRSSLIISQNKLHGILLQIFITHLLLYMTIMTTISAVIVNWQKLKRANANLLEAQIQAERLNKAKNRFLAGISESIFVPLETLVSFADILVQRVSQYCRPDQKDEVEGVFEIIRSNGQMLSKEVNDIVDFAKIEANMLQIEMKPVSLQKLISEVCQEAKPNVAAKNLDFSVNLQNNILPLILTDPVRLRQLLLNIINNAVILSNRGAIQISCSLKRPTTEYDFAAATAAPVPDDSKITLDAKHPFSAVTMVQVDIVATGAVFSSRLRHSSGFATNLGDSALLDTNCDGLGLNIGKRLADLMDGTIFVSGVPGSGTKFSLLLNVYVPFDGQTENVLVQSFRVTPVQGSQLEPGLNIRPADKLAKEAQEQPQTGQMLQDTRILVVDDVAVNQLAMTTQLRNAGAIVDVSNNGSAAVKKVNDNADNGIFYDIILMDVQMPVMDGFQATMVLRKQGHKIPIVAVTARSEDAERSIEAGCNDCIFKPVFTNALISAVQKYLK